MPPPSPSELAGRVRDAITRAGLRHGDVARQVGLDPTALSKALNGQRHFRTLEIALIAELLAIPVGQLISDDLGVDVAVAARAQPSSDHDAVAAALDLVTELLDLDALLTELGYASPAWRVSPPPPPPGDEIGQSEVRQGAVLAEELRRRLSDESLPGDLDRFAHWIEEKLGVCVHFAPLPSGLDGLSVARRDFRLALVSSTVSATRQRFTLAHELGHLCAGDAENVLVDEDVFIDRSPREVRANSFAANFLMPAEQLRERCRAQDVDEDLVSRLTGEYRVSVDALAFRLHNLDIVDGAGRDRVRAMNSRKIALRAGRLDDLRARDEHRVSGLLLQRTLDAFTDGRISIRPLASLLRAPADELLAEMSPSVGDSAQVL